MSAISPKKIKAVKDRLRLMIAGAKPPDFPKFLLNRDGSSKGAISGTRDCRMAGCTGVALSVRWPGGHRTYPCTKGMKKTGQADTWQLE